MPRAKKLSTYEQREIEAKWRRSLSKKPMIARRPFEEFIVQKNGQVRQAGATNAEDPLVSQFRMQAERDLFTFNFGVLDQWWLYPPLHQAICKWLQRCPPHRKALVVPRGHGKSTIGCQGMPLHMIIQPREHNIYLQGMLGTDTRILLAGETILRAQDHLGVIADQAVNNTLLRGLWPHIAWENPKRESKKWNESELIFPRERQFPDPTIRAIGVGGAVTGAHPPVMIKDDITTEAAANSPTVMNTAIRWHENIRAVLASQGADPLEFIYGTRWAVGDMIDRCEADPTVEVNSDWRQITDGGKVIYPENSRGDLTDFGREGAVEKLMNQHKAGGMFWLLYMNSVGDSNLVDFSAADLREFEFRSAGDQRMIMLTEDDRDVQLAAAMKGKVGGGSAWDEPENGGRGMKLSEYMDWQDSHRASSQLDPRRLEYIRGARNRRPYPLNEKERGE